MQELFISKQEDKKVIALIENGKLIEVYEEKDTIRRLEGNIYVGKVKDILKGMQAAFVDIGEGKNTFIHIKDIIPKVSDVTGNKEENLENYNIKDYLKVGQNILLQVKKDSVDTKGARITCNIQITGRFIVLLPENEFITISQKIEEVEERERLINIVKDTLGNRKIGAIVRTAAYKKDENEIRQDIVDTLKKLEEIKQKSNNISDEEVPAILYENESIIDKILLDLSDNKLDKIIVDDEKVYREVQNKLKQINKKSDIKIEIKENVLDIYDTDDQIQKLSNRKIWLKCGGFITIDKTEALTAIDVNSGKFIGKENLEKTILKVNEEASIEIARQLRLRDIGGIIIIDYIDMKEDSKNRVIEILKNELKKDRAKTQIVDYTKLNLLEMTRKHLFSNG